MSRADTGGETGRQKDERLVRHDEANTYLSQLYVNASKELD